MSSFIYPVLLFDDMNFILYKSITFFEFIYILSITQKDFVENGYQKKTLKKNKKLKKIRMKKYLFFIFTFKIHALLYIQ